MEISAQIFTSILASTRSTASKDDLLLMTSTNPLDGFVHRTTLTTNVAPLTDERLNRIQKTNQADEVEDDMKCKWMCTWHWQAYARQPASLRSLPVKKILKTRHNTMCKTTMSLRSFPVCKKLDTVYCAKHRFYLYLRQPVCLTFPSVCLTFQPREVRDVVPQEEVVRALQPSHLVGSI